MRFVILLTTLFACVSVAMPDFVRADMSTSVATGTITANRSVTLATRIMGRIISVHAEEGDPVTAGQVLVEIDDADLEARLKVAEATKVESAGRVSTSSACKGTANQTPEEQGHFRGCH